MNNKLTAPKTSSSSVKTSILYANIISIEKTAGITCFRKSIAKLLIQYDKTLTPETNCWCFTRSSLSFTVKVIKLAGMKASAIVNMKTEIIPSAVFSMFFKAKVSLMG